MTVFGYRPGTSVAACGEGRRDAMVGVVGLLLGAALYAASYPQLSGILKSWGDAGEITLPEWSGTSPWLWVVGLCHAALGAFALFARRSQDVSPSSIE